MNVWMLHRASCYEIFHISLYPPSRFSSRFSSLHTLCAQILFEFTIYPDNMSASYNKTWKICRSLFIVDCSTSQSTSIICWCSTNWVSTISYNQATGSKKVKRTKGNTLRACSMPNITMLFFSHHTYLNTKARGAVDLMTSRTKVRPHAIQVDELLEESNVIIWVRVDIWFNSELSCLATIRNKYTKYHELLKSTLLN